ncbi:hypothetical protein MMC11_004658 [Xylographa trunciseda]|nr:hypothetical protein [Xylographa trunciseda]
MCILLVQHYTVCGHSIDSGVKKCYALWGYTHTPHDGVYRKRVPRDARCPRCEFEHHEPFLRARARILSDPQAIVYPERKFVSPYAEKEEGKGPRRAWWDWRKGGKGGK